MENNSFQEEDTQHGRFLTFALGSEVFGLDITHVTGIVGLQPITAIPDVPEYVRGIINLRGKIIPVIDMRLRFGREPSVYTDRTCIIEVNIQGTSVGLIVESVSEVLTIEDANIVPPPPERTGARNGYIAGIGKVGTEIKLLLDCDKLFQGVEIDRLQTIG